MPPRKKFFKERHVTGPRWKKILYGIGFVLLLLFLYDTVMPPVSTLMFARFMTAQPVSRDWVPLRHISRPMIEAVLAAEDSGFCDHHGIDWKALHGAVKHEVQTK